MVNDNIKINEILERNNIRYKAVVHNFINMHRNNPDSSYFHLEDSGLIGAIHIKHASLYGLNNFLQNFPEIDSNILLNENEYVVHCMVSDDQYTLGKLIKKFVEDKAPNNIYFYNLKSKKYSKWSKDYLNKLISIYSK